MATNNDPDTLDAYSTTMDVVRTIHYHTHEQLYVYDEKYEHVVSGLFVQNSNGFLMKYISRVVLIEIYFRWNLIFRFAA